MLEAGTEGYQELVVAMEDTALAAGSGGPVSYTHLDVYKRQAGESMKTTSTETAPPL